MRNTPSTRTTTHRPSGDNALGFAVVQDSVLFESFTYVPFCLPVPFRRPIPVGGEVNLSRVYLLKYAPLLQVNVVNTVPEVVPRALVPELVNVVNTVPEVCLDCLSIVI